jgi:Na+/phosphate symporter
MFAQVGEMLRYTRLVLEEREADSARTSVQAIEKDLIKLHRQSYKKIRSSLEEGGNVRLELHVMDIINAAAEIRDLLVTIVEFDQAKRASVAV